MIGYNYDGNYIKLEPLKNREGATITSAYLKLSFFFNKAGLKPNTWVMDSETSTKLKNKVHKAQMSFQLVPAYTHCSNAAERAIQTWKAHFKTGLPHQRMGLPAATMQYYVESALFRLHKSKNFSICLHGGRF